MVDRIGGDINPLAGSSGSVADENGETLLSTDTTGGNAYILGPTMLRSIIGGVANGDWAKPPLDPSAVISDDNGLPYWDWVPAASGKVTVQVVADGTSASGNVLRFTAVGAGTADTSYVERYISVLGSRGRTITYQPRSVWSAATNNANLRVFTEAVFIKNDGTTTTGGTATSSATGSAVASSTYAREVQANPNTNGAVPTDGAFIRLRVGVSFAATVSGTATADCCEVRIDTGLPQVLITDNAAPETYGYAVAYLNNGGMWIRANEAGTAGSNPTMFMSGSTGDIALRSYYGVGTAVPSSGHIYLQPKETTGNVYVTDGTASATATIRPGQTTNLSHGVTVNRTTDLTINTSDTTSATAISWSGAVEESALYDYWTSGTTITVPVTGYYAITATLIFGTGTGYAARLFCVVNGTVLGETQVQAGANTSRDTIALSTLLYLTAGDAIVFRASSNGASGKVITGASRSRASVVYLGNHT